MSRQVERVVYLYPSKEGVKGKARFARFTGKRVKQGKAGKADPFSPESPLPGPGKAYSKIAPSRPFGKILLYPRSGKAEKKGAAELAFSGGFIKNKVFGGE